jgi:hypothetical protein
MGVPELEAVGLDEDRYSPGEVIVAGVDEKRIDASPNRTSMVGSMEEKVRRCQLAAIPIELLTPSSP